MQHQDEEQAYTHLLHTHRRIETRARYVQWPCSQNRLNEALSVFETLRATTQHCNHVHHTINHD